MECNKCGECCKWVILENINPTLTLFEYFAVREWIYNKRTKQLWIPSRCPDLTEDNLCNSYNLRPVFCRKFAGFKHPLPGVTEKCACVRHKK